MDALQAAPRAPAGTEAEASELLAIIDALMRETHSGGPRPALDSLLERDLGIDSLARVELLIRIERAFQKRLPEHLVTLARTPRDLLHALLLGAQWERAAPAVVPVGQAAVEAVAPEAAQTLTDVLAWHAAAHAERVHVLLAENEGEPEAIRYGGLYRDALAVAAGLARMGTGSGQAIVLMLPTAADFFRAFFGVLLAGAVPVPIYPPVRGSPIEDPVRRQSGILANCGATVLIAPEEARTASRLLRDRAPALRSIVSVAMLMRREEGMPPLPGLRPGDPALIQYTSGSTGNPKGVLLSHANILANLRAMGSALRVQASDVFVSWLPLYHDMGLIGAWLGSLYFASTLVVMPPTAFLMRPARWLWAIHRYGGTLSCAPNFAYELCASRIDERELEGLDLSSWRLAMNGSEPVSADTLARFGERFGPRGLKPDALAPVYGLAECTVGLAFPPLGRPPLIDRVDRSAFLSQQLATAAAAGDRTALVFVSCGQPLAGHQVRVVGEDGREKPERVEGRVQFCGPSATRGYYRNPDATAALLAGEWLDTGDLGYIAGGELFLTGRSKDIIIRGGQHVHPQELEEALGRVAGIRKGCVAVFGVADPAAGTEKVVVLAETRVRDRERLAQLRSSVAAQVVSLLGAPADDIVLAAPHTILKTSSGKIRRSASREAYERGLVRAGRFIAWRHAARFGFDSARARLLRRARDARAWGYAGYAWAVFGLCAAAACAAMLLPRRLWRRAAMSTVARAGLQISGLRLQCRGLERPLPKPLMVVCNHASYFDAVVLFAMLRGAVSFVAKRELAERRPLRWLLHSIGVRFIERFDVERGAAETSELARLAGRGESLLFFPEGTFARAPGLLPFHMGAFVIAAAAGTPVLPLVLRGTRSVLREGSWFPRRAGILLMAGPLLHPQGSDWAAAAMLRDAAREEILERCGEPDLGTEPYRP